jgi:2-polyprenyl-3-methyl-5-hydroxy-6-metoxy-1,4-benzoquinol methylase
MLKKGKCYYCQSTNYKTLYIRGKYKINQCLICGFIYTFPTPSNNYLNKYYSKFDNNLLNKQKIIEEDSFRELNAIYRYKNNRKSLIDIGCGNGIFLEQSKSFGFDPTGLDVSNKFIIYFKKVLNIPFVHADIRNYKSKRQYDVLTLNQVVEHSSDPELIIRRCYDLLSDNGLISIATPNIQSLTALIRKEHFDYLIPPEHLSYFSKDSLILMLKRNRFKIVKIKTWFYPVDIAGILKELFQKNKLYYFEKNRSVKSYITVKEAVKYLKHILFDRILCVLLCRILNTFHNNGTMVQVIAQKI